MDFAKEFLELFSGSQKIFGVTTPTGKVTPQGKRECQCYTKHKQVSVEEWRSHILGKNSLGCGPLNNESLVRWGAIDVDDYTVKVADIAKNIADLKLPIATCMSKSGGAHLYVFSTEWIPAQKMIALLESFAAALGVGKSEIFPKQSVIGTHDFGNWINMPYFGGDRAVRYCMQPDGSRRDMKEFLEYVDTIRINPEQVEKFTERQKDPYPEYPPCLNEIFKQKICSHRNTTLSNMCVAIKKEFPDDWKSKVEEANRRFAEPLSNKEVDNVIKSHEKKDYFFQCPKEPLCNHCNTAICRSRKYGVGADGPIPGDRSLTMVRTVPPVWHLDMHNPDGTCTRVSLDTDELRKPDLFEKRIMETMGSLPPIYKKDDWYTIVNHLMSKMNVVEVPVELTPKGQFIELLREFLVNRSVEGSTFEMVLRGNPHKDDVNFYFRSKDFKAYLESARFHEIKPNQQVAILQQDLGAKKLFLNIAGKGVNLISIPADFDTKKPEFTNPEIKEEEF